jgi:starch-binding outer membrane protein, SusD/RagB family
LPNYSSNSDSIPQRDGIAPIAKNMKKQIIALLTLAFFLGSCSKLDVTSLTDVTDEKVFQNADGVRSALIGMYSQMQQREYYGAFYPLMSDLHTDMVVAGGYENTVLNEFGDKTVTPSNGFIEQMYVSMYKTIRMANGIIGALETKSDDGFEAAEKNAILGQALAVRALAHFDLLRMFGYHWDINSPNGIPIVTAIQKATDVVDRSTVKATYDAISKDLLQAETLLKTTKLDGNHLNSNAVKGLLARLYLYKKDYINAKKYAADVIKVADYALVHSSDIASIYADRLSTESIFELGFDIQNQSNYNALTYGRKDALQAEIFYLAAGALKEFFDLRADDPRAAFTDYEKNADGFLPNGRSQKYRGEVSKDNPAYILRLAEMHLILAESNGFTKEGVGILNDFRVKRGLKALKIENADEFKNVLLDEIVAEFNFEGHYYFDLARLGLMKERTGVANFRAVFPLPLREINVSQGKMKQNPQY